MTLTEKILIGFVLFFGLTIKILGLFEIKGAVLFLILTYFSLIGLIIYYITRIKLSIYSVILGLMIIGTIGMFFKIQHWPGAGIMTLLGLLGIIIFSGLLLWAVIKKKNEINMLYSYIIAGILLTQIVLSIIANQKLLYYAQLLNYLTVATIGTMKIKHLKINIETNKILNVLLIQGILFIISHTINMIK